MNRRISLFLLVSFAALAFMAWATDFVTSPGEWTVYTAACNGGVWKEARCTGRIDADKRYRFRALKTHREVLFWTAGESGESGRYLDCDVLDGRTWQCPPEPAGKSRTITHQMVRGFPIAERGSDPIEYHQVPKWKWELLRLGIRFGGSALN